MVLVAKALGQPGDLDASFGSQGKTLYTETSEARSVIALRDGKLLVGGSFGTGTYPDKAALFRLSADGSRDIGFGNNGMVLFNFSGWIAGLHELDDGRVVAVVDQYDYYQGAGLVRLNQDGSIDSTFGTGGSSPFVQVNEPRAIAVQRDGCILMTGYSWNGGHSEAVLVRYLPGGALDMDFGIGGILTPHFGNEDNYATDVAVQPDGRLVLAGFAWVGTGWDFALARFTPGGVLDPSFGNGGKVTTDFQQGGDLASGIVMQPDGKIVVGGSSGPPGSGGNAAVAVTRYLPDGSLDPSFGLGGKMILQVANRSCVVRDVALLRNGRIVLTGETFEIPFMTVQLLAARFNADGSVDGTFGSNGVVLAQAGVMSGSADTMALQPDGRVVLAGTYSLLPIYSAVALIRIEGDPTPPDVDALAVSEVSETGITLRGAVNPNGMLTNAQFEFGPTTSYGSTAFVTLNPASGRAWQNVSAGATGLTPGCLYYYRLTASNAAGSSVTETGTFGTLITHEAWRQRYFGTPGGTGPAADTFDFDNDGMNNLLEWACGLNPAASDALPLQTELTGGTFHLTYRRSVSAMNEGKTFTVEWADSLSGNPWSDAGVSHEIISTHGAFEIVRAVLPTASNGGRRFARLRVD